MCTNIAIPINNHDHHHEKSQDTFLLSFKLGSGFFRAPWVLATGFALPAIYGGIETA